MKKCNPMEHLLDEEILFDVESDIDKSWEDLRNDYKQKKAYQEVKTEKSKRFDFPSFLEFYDLLLKLKYEYSSGKDTHHYLLHESYIMASRMINRSEEPMPTSFRKVWEIFCNPRCFKTAGFNCGCGKSYDIMFRPQSLAMEDYQVEGEFNATHAQEYHMRSNHIFCPNCRANAMTITGDLVGVFEREKVEKINLEGGGNGRVVGKSEHYF